MKKKVLIGLLALSMVISSFGGKTLFVNANEQTAVEIEEAIEEQQEESKAQTEEQLQKRAEKVATFENVESTSETPAENQMVLTDVSLNLNDVTYDNLGEISFDLYTGNYQYSETEKELGAELLIGIEKEKGDPYYLCYWPVEKISYEQNHIHVNLSEAEDFDKYDITPGEWNVVDIMYLTPGDGDEVDYSKSFYYLTGAIGEDEFLNCEYKGKNKINVSADIITVNSISLGNDKTVYNRGENGVVIVNITNNTDKDIEYLNNNMSFYWGAENDDNGQMCTDFREDGSDFCYIPAKESKDIEIPFTVTDDTVATNYSYRNLLFAFSLGSREYALGYNKLYISDGSEDSLAFNIPESVLSGAKISVTDKKYKYILGESQEPASFFSDGTGMIQFEDGTEMPVIIPLVEYVDLSKSSFTYNGKVQKPKVTSVADRAYKPLTLGEDYTVSYSNSTSKKVGIYGVQIELKGCYDGEKIVEYRINPKGTKISKVKAGKKRTFAVTWKKQRTQTTGYQIQYSKDVNFDSGVKTVTVKNNKSTSKQMKVTKKGTYYVRIRTYKKCPTGKCYSSWSSVKSVKVK